MSLDFCIRLTRAQSNVIRRLDVALSIHGLSFNDFMILHYLEKAPEAKLRRIDLAERLSVTASGVTRSLLPLEKLGQVSRIQDPRDARVGYAVLTDAGRELLLNATATIAPVTEEITRSIDSGVLESTSTLLGQLAGLNLTNH